MPELAEAETIARGLDPHLRGVRIEGVEVLRSDLLPQGAEQFRSRLEGVTIHRVGRRGKNLVFRLGSGGVLLVNLGMTGRMLLPGARTWGEGSGHVGIRFRLPDGASLEYDDSRRFGTLEALTAREWRFRSARLGPEPLGSGFTTEVLRSGLARSRSPIRSWLLDQRRIAGVGNIYANEALWWSRIHPARSALSLGAGEVEDLHRSLRRVLRRAIRMRGTTLRDYRDPEGGEGSFGRLLRVYGREGERCRRCRAAIERGVLSNRSFFFCPSCQIPEPVPE